MLLLSGTAAGATAASGSASASTARNTTSATVKIASYNTQFGRSPDAVVREVRRLGAEGADIIALQEMGSPKRRQAVRDRLVNCGYCVWDAFMTNLREQNATPILYRSSQFRLLATGAEKVSNRTFVGGAGAGPSTLKAKYVVWVHLRHLASGQHLYVLNNHAVASVQGPGGGRNKRAPKRLALYRDHMHGLTSLIEELPSASAVFVTGDFNVNYRRDAIVRDSMFPFHNLSQVDVAASYRSLGQPKVGTHGSGDRLIDYVHHRRQVDVTPRSQSILRGYGSDHRPVMVGYGLEGQGRRKR